jgi:hypothetical protein
MSRTKEEQKVYNRQYYLKNKTNILDRTSNYYKNNRKEMLLYQKNYQIVYKAKKRLSDPMFKLSENLRNLLHISFKRKGFCKKSKTYQLLGADFDTVHTHLVLTAIKNYGFWLETELYHVDHIIPCSSAKTEEELIKLQHYTNLQYLTPEDNLKKSDNF